MTICTCQALSKIWICAFAPGEQAIPATTRQKALLIIETMRRFQKYITRRISVVLSVYSGKKFLVEQLESILQQSYSNLEIILLDDASTDDSLYLISALVARDRRILVLRNERSLGVLASFMKGISLSTGEFIAFSDQDDTWKREKVDILKNLLSADQKNMLACSDLEV